MRVPVPHVLLHVCHSLHAEILQSTGHRLAPHEARSVSASQTGSLWRASSEPGVCRAAMKRPTPSGSRARTLVPVPQLVLHAVHAPHVPSGWHWAGHFCVLQAYVAKAN